jgi:hypothetical protein
VNTTIQLQIRVPDSSAQDTAIYIKELLERLGDGAYGGSVGARIEFIESERTVDAALAYYKRAWPKRSANLARLHDSLINLGYEARLPETRSESRNQYPYLRYVYPGGDRTLGVANSGSFAFVGGSFQDRLAHEPGGQATRDGVRFQLDSPDAVDRIIRIAQNESPSSL